MVTINSVSLGACLVRSWVLLSLDSTHWCSGAFVAPVKYKILTYFVNLRVCFVPSVVSNQEFHLLKHP